MKQFLFFILINISVAALAQDTDILPQKNFHKPFKTNIIKAGPVLFNQLVPLGVFAAYETGIGSSKLSLNTLLRYHSGTDKGLFEIPAHFRFELQPRYWPMDFLKGVFFAPSLLIYDKGVLGAGGAIGYQNRISRHITLEGFSGLLTSNKIEQFEFGIYFRLGFGIGYYFKTKTNNENNR